MPTGGPIRTAPLPPASDIAREAGKVELAPSPSPPASAVVPAETPAPTLPKVCATCQNRYPADFLVCPRDATPLTDESGSDIDPLLGKVLGEAYQIVRAIGEGGMGRVYEARHTRLKDRRYAVKVLHPEFARDQEIVARFQREAESASSIGHPNVVEVYDVNTTPDGLPYIVAEYLEGEEFGGQIEKLGRTDVPTSIHVTREVCHALAAAHERGIVHRDMKPENVFLVERDGALSVKVIDFGISKAGTAAGSPSLTRTGMIMGTPSYMSPEQARGDKVDLRADVYAVGAMLYHALTGKRPFEAEDPTSTLSLVLTEEPARPRSLNAKIPEALELVIQKAMAKEPGDRYATMPELDAALAPFDSGDVKIPTAMQAVVHKGTVVSRGGADPNARTMMASGVSQTESPGMSRPTIVLGGLGVVLWMIVGAVDALGGVVRYLRGDELTSVETILLTVGASLVVASPAAFFMVHVKRKVWPNSVKAMELARDVRSVFLWAVVTYGLAALGLRAGLTVYARQSVLLGNGFWDFTAFGVSAALTGFVFLIGRIARAWRRRRKS